MTWAAGWVERRAKTWRWRFAVVPIRIHDQWVWLTRYRFRGNGCAFERARDIEGQQSPYRLVLFY